MRAAGDQRVCLFISLLLLTTVAGGCVDLSAVRELAAISSESISHTELICDYVEQPDRLKMYQPEDRHAELTAESAARRKQAAALRAVQDVLAGYLDALGELASDDLSDYSRELDALARQVKGTGKWFSGSDVEAVSKATGGIARALTDFYRRKELKKLITTTDSSIEQLTADLIMIFGKIFNESLNNELANLRRFEQGIVRVPGTDEGARKLAVFTLARERLVIARKKAALAAYVKVLKGVRAGHAGLCRSVDDLRDKKALGAIYKKAKQLVKDLRAVYELMR